MLMNGSYIYKPKDLEGIEIEDLDTLFFSTKLLYYNRFGPFGLEGFIFPEKDYKTLVSEFSSFKYEKVDKIYLMSYFKGNLHANSESQLMDEIIYWNDYFTSNGLKRVDDKNVKFKREKYMTGFFEGDSEMIIELAQATDPKYCCGLKSNQIIILDKELF